MKNYLAIFTGTPAGRQAREALDDGTRKQRESAGMAAWKKWVEDHAGSIVERGSPLGKTKRVGCDGVADIRNQMAAWTVVRADSHDAAARPFEHHPHFAIFPGDGVEVMECPPIPGQ